MVEKVKSRSAGKAESFCFRAGLMSSNEESTL